MERKKLTDENTTQSSLASQDSQNI